MPIIKKSAPLNDINQCSKKITGIILHLFTCHVYMIRNYDAICRILLNTEEEAIAVLDKDGAPRYTNEAFNTLFSPAAMAAAPGILALLFPAALREYSTWRGKLAPGAKAFIVTSPVNNGSKAGWMKWTIMPIFTPAGEPDELLVTGHNITEIILLKTEKEKLFDTLQAFKTAIDTHIICTITDKKGVITYANEQFCTISGYTHDELIGKTHNIVNSGHHDKSFFAGMWSTILSGRAWTGQVKNRTKTGGYYWVESVIIPIKDTSGRIDGFVSLRIPIDDQKEKEEERIRYIASLQNLLYMVSHEIRRPIVNCEGLLRLLQDDMPPTRDEYDQAIQALLHSAAELDAYSRSLNDQIMNFPGMV